MRAKVEDILLNALGIFILIYGILAVANSVRLSNFLEILWICYFCLILIGLGVLLRSSLLIASQVNLLLIPDLFWNVDFFYRFFSGESFLGITDYLFDFFSQGKFFSAIISLQHIFIIPVIFYVLYILRVPRKGSLKLSFFQITLVFIVTRIFSFTGSNINCAFRPCVDISVSIPYIILWFLTYGSFIVVSEIALRRIFSDKRKR